MDENVKRSLIENYIAAYNSFDIDGMMAVLHSDIEFKNVSSGEVNVTASGVKEFRQLAEYSKELFRSRRQTVISSWSNPDQTTIEVAFEGTLAFGLQNGMKAGETLRLNGRSEFTFRDEKICRIIDVS
jgi:ketosteroid isomerase-like protein